MQSPSRKPAGHLSFVRADSDRRQHILSGTAALLLVVGASWLRGRERIAAALLALAPMLTTSAGARALPEHLRVVGRVQTSYGLIEVIDDASRRVRLMRADHSIIGARTADGTGAFAYTHVLEALRFARPSATDMLQIGLGTGTLPLAMQRRGIAVEVVEIDPGVVELAKAFFDYSGEVAIEDARTFINRASKRYDFVVHDTFTGGVTPAHLLSLEVIERARALLRPGGILVVNLPGFSDGPHAGASHALAKTMRDVFPTVRVFRDSAAKETPSLSNLLSSRAMSPLSSMRHRGRRSRTAHANAP